MSGRGRYGAGGPCVRRECQEDDEDGASRVAGQAADGSYDDGVGRVEAVALLEFPAHCAVGCDGGPRRWWVGARRCGVGRVRDARLLAGLPACAVQAARDADDHRSGEGPAGPAAGVGEGALAGGGIYRIPRPAVPEAGVALRLPGRVVVRRGPVLLVVTPRMVGSAVHRSLPA